MTKTLRLAALGCALLSVSAQLGLAQQPSSPPASIPPLRVGSGDLLDVTIYDNPDLSGHFRVDEKGDIIVPLLGAVHVEGQTAQEVGKTLEKRYKEEDILKEPQDHATVLIAEYASQGITVSGEVKSPGLFPALGMRMLHDVITAAGGVQITASSKVIVLRKNDLDHPLTVTYNPEALNPVIPRVQIFPGDTIMVPRAGKVYIVGNVTRPGAYVLEGRDRLTVEEAIALAGNTGRGASTKNVHLVREQEGGRKEDIALNLKLILKGRAPDAAMKDGDILYVPTSSGKLATEQAITSAIGIGTQVITYRTALQ